ncbi:MAG: ECF transporter S component [Oscillospiraceae bacterium]|nr:ECF transporter S component [Oscillospiraceae bacterium]
MLGTALLAAFAFVLQFWELPMPLSPAFARMDLSDLPALIGAFAYGPFWGIGIELLKNVLHLPQSATAGVGELANFLMGAALTAPAGFIYRNRKSRRGALAACLCGSLCMGIASAVSNYYILLPLFEGFMPIEQMIEAFAEFIPLIHSKLGIVLLNALPMNILKGLMISMITMLLYKRISPVLKGR